MTSTGALTDRRGLWAFIVGVVAVAVGVVVHVQMFLMAGGMGYRMVGMPIDNAMIVAMALIVAGIGIAAYGCSRERSRQKGILRASSSRRPRTHLCHGSTGG